MPEPTTRARKRIALVCTVWGQNFVEVFCENCLASLLAANNLPRVSSAYDITLLLYTSKEDQARLHAHQNFRKVASLIEIRPVFLEALPAAARGGHWIQWQHAVANSAEFSACILIIPDCVYANTHLHKVLDALETSDIVYYSLPEVCLEPIRPRLRTLHRQQDSDRPYSTLDLSEQEVLNLLIEFIHPKHAVALYKPDYFVQHTEYVMAASKGRLELTELACQPFGISGRVKTLSYTFNPITAAAKLSFLEILGISCESTLKYIAQYFRWSADRMDLSRSSNLAGWYYTFSEPGVIEYSKTKTVVTLAGSQALSQEQGEVTKPRLIYARTISVYQTALFSLHALAASACQWAVPQFIALAMHAPGFRKAIMRRGVPLTVLLPLSNQAVEILHGLYDRAEAAPLVDFLLMHLVPGKLALKVGQHFLLDDAQRSRSRRTQFQVIDAALAAQSSDAVTGTISSQPYYFGDEIVAYLATMKYGSARRFTAKGARAASPAKLRA